ncbi:LacI family DNA-binding transcriptional regulator [Nocardioides sp. GY 10127]|uniref:LacI family DNA-binding transcriptional regulator n=1 Tax=Nocardioides sp. GY 10127 TaxID=2569762 RepID=UPI0010A7F589|nr:LacI family DNA-binding transcriptional regulator [Nocardioides sp. GY 10127]TIC80155.1 LacI family DNA-binding transcriptional regulator [Nocardioides sp. GY 10127]
MAKVTLQSIADAVGVSRMTVSNAFSRPQKLSAELRARILATADEMGYVGPDPAARALARGRTGTVGLLWTGWLGENADDAVSMQMLVTVADALAERGLALTLLPAGLAGEDVVPTRDVPMDGALVYTCEPDSPDVAWLRKRELPLVTIDQVPLPDVAAINVDDRGGARAAAQHLLDLGHRRIGLVQLAPVQEDTDSAERAQEISNPPATERMSGWREALAAAGVEPAAVRLVPVQPRTRTFEVVREMLDAEQRPTALLCFSDTLAAQAVRAAESLGLRVPDDLSVVGFDDSSVAQALGLTTVSQPLAEKGRLAVQLLVDAIASTRAGEQAPDGQTPDEQPRHVLPTSVVVRGSTAPPPQR